MPIQWPHKLNFQHKIIEKKLFLRLPLPFFPPSLREFLNKYSEREKEFNPSAMFGIQGGRGGKTAVKTFILQRVQPPSSPPCLRASRFLTFSSNTRRNAPCPQRLRPLTNSFHKCPSLRWVRFFFFGTNPEFHEGPISSQMEETEGRKEVVTRDSTERQ